MALLLTETDVCELLPAAELIEAMDRALAAFSSGLVTQPVRTAVQVGATRNFLGVMPAYLSSRRTRDQTRDGLRRKLRARLALSSRHHHPVESEYRRARSHHGRRYITASRTAAVSAVAIRQLARKDAAILAILGSGVQARSHAEVLPLAREFREIRA